MRRRTKVQFFCSTWGLSFLWWGREREWQLLADSLHRRQHHFLSAAQDRHSLGPASAEIGARDRPDPLANNAFAAVGDAIDLQVAGPVQFLPLTNYNRHFFAEESPRLGLGQPARKELPTLAPELAEVAFHSRHACQLQLLFNLRAHVELTVALQQCRERGQEWPQPLCANVARGFPQNFQCALELQAIA